MTIDTVFELASVTKQFTAMAIMTLVDDGGIGLQNSVKTYLPSVPSAWQDVTIRHLLTHTSGIPNYFDLPMFHSKSSKSEFSWRLDYTQEEFLEAVSAASLDFSPGEQAMYSNTGYHLLGMIVERVTGEPYEAVLAERIFGPLEMTATRRNSRTAIIPNRASGYALQNDILCNAEYTSSTWAYAEGGLVSSISDMVKWDCALATSRLLSHRSSEEIWEPARLNSGQVTEYGFGWVVDASSRQKVVSHGGGKPGFSTHIARYLSDKVTVIVLANRDDVGAKDLSKGIARIWLSKPV